jgi:hypothetical protein
MREVLKLEETGMKKETAAPLVLLLSGNRPSKSCSSGRNLLINRVIKL